MSRTQFQGGKNSSRLMTLFCEVSSGPISHVLFRRLVIAATALKWTNFIIILPKYLIW